MSQPKPKPRILFFNPVRHALGDYEALHAVASPEVVTSTSRRELFDDLKAKYHDIQAIYRTSASGAVSTPTHPPPPHPPVPKIKRSCFRFHP